MKRLMDWIAGRCGYVPEAALVVEARAHLRSCVEIETLENVLIDIIAQDTPNGNATVKRMVKLARDGLGGA